ncbi:hypothetical protein EX30DRAFT_374617, partial [Ascodesmis nigricans]
RAEEHVEERVTENLEDGLPTLTNTIDLTTRIHTQAEAKKIPKFDPKERARLSQKRPRSWLPLVKTALKETELELATLRKEVVEL